MLGVQDVDGVQKLESTGKEMEEPHVLRARGERMKEVWRWSRGRGRLHGGVTGLTLYPGRVRSFVEEPEQKRKDLVLEGGRIRVVLESSQQPHCEDG